MTVVSTQQAAEASRGPCIVTRAEAPFEVVAVNTQWSDLCEYAADEALGKSPKDLLHGRLTDSAKASSFTHRLLAYGSARVTLINYRRSGVCFLHKIRARLVSLDGAKFFVTESEEMRDPVLSRAICARANHPMPYDGEALVVTGLWIIALGLMLWHSLTTIIRADEDIDHTTADIPRDLIIPLSLFDSGMMLIG